MDINSKFSLNNSFPAYNIDMTESTAQQILQLLQDIPSATALEVSEYLHITKADAHYHISNLLRAGLVEVSSKGIQPGLRGRPARSFQLAALYRPNNHTLLLKAILQLHPDILRNKDNLKALCTTLTPSCDQLLPLRTRVVTTSAYLAENNYHPTWEASPSGPKFILHYCPYLTILENHPEICELDLLLLNHRMGLPVTMLQNRSYPDGLNNPCTFQVWISD